MANGRTMRILSIIDTFTRECLGLEVDTCLPSRRVTRALDGVIAERGRPERIRMDNVLNASVFLIAGHSKSEGRAMRGLFVNEQFSSAERPVVST
jgi:putative transposase